MVFGLQPVACGCTAGASRLIRRLLVRPRLLSELCSTSKAVTAPELLVIPSHTPARVLISHAIAEIQRREHWTGVWNTLENDHDISITVQFAILGLREKYGYPKPKAQAAIGASVATEERRALLRRTRSGLRQARAAGKIDAGASYRAVADGTPNVTCQTLSNIDRDKKRRAWYLKGDAADDRVDAALDEVRTG